MDLISSTSKPELAEVETTRVDEKSTEVFTNAQQRRLLWRTDLRILPMLAIVYSVSVIDRINIGSARVLGMSQDLGLDVGNRYSVILLLFFPAYALADIPSNILLVRLTPKYWLSFLMISWGAVLTGMAFTNNWKVMVFLRFLLGLFEGGVLPAMVYIIGSWYGRYEMHRRISMSYGFGILSSAFAGVLSYALGLMGGLRGMNGWRWVFSIEGGASILIGIVAFFALPSFPDKAKWLKPEEKSYLLDKLQKDRGDSDTEPVTLKVIQSTLMDWTLWLHAVVFCFNVSSAYALAFFGPTILVGLGYTGLTASLYSAWPYFATLGLLGIGSFVSDKLQLRAPVAIFQALVQLVGFILVRPYYSNEVRYLGIFLATMGTQCNAVALIVFSQSNTIGSATRSVSSATIIGFSALGGIIGSTIFREQDAPSYGPGIYTTIGMVSFNIMAVTILVLNYYRQNKKADRDGNLIGGVPGYRYSM